MKYTLLELTQAVLSSMDSDEINSIDDTVESQQVVEVIKTVYDDIISRGDLNSNKTLFNLTASSDLAKPIIMTKPEDIDRIDWIKYDIQGVNDTTPNWTLMRYLPVEDFIDYMHQYNQNYDYIESFDQQINNYTIKFTYRNDTAPTYFTSFDDNIIIFDSYDSDVDDTLQSSKTMCYGFKATTFQRLDTFVPELQPQQFALLLNEAKSLAWAELKQAVHQKAEVTARRGWRHLQKTRQSIPDTKEFNGNKAFDLLPNYARRR